MSSASYSFEEVMKEDEKFCKGGIEWDNNEEKNTVINKSIEIKAEKPKDILEDYDYMLKEYDFSVRWKEEKGKYVCANKNIDANYDILLESPLAVWPIRGCVDLLNLKFCENCLQIEPVESGTLLDPLLGINEGDNHSFSEINCDNKKKESKMVSISENLHNQIEEMKQREEKFFVDGKTDKNEVTNNDGGLYITDSGLLKNGKIYFCSKICMEQALGEAASTVLNISACSDGYINNNEKSEVRWVGGWMRFLPIEALRKLRHAQVLQDASRDIPITLEAIGRILAKVCATTEFLHVHKSFPLDTAFSIAWRPFQRLAFPNEWRIEDIIDWQTAKFELEDVLAERIKEKLGEEIMQYMTSMETIQRLMALLIINSQALNIWGVLPGWDITAVRAAGVYTLQACFNHSCNPNCCVTSHDYNTVISVTTLRNINEGEELTISYIPTHLSVEKRQSLLSNYLFVCQCERCVRESNNCVLS